MGREGENGGDDKESGGVRVTDLSALFVLTATDTTEKISSGSGIHLSLFNETPRGRGRGRLLHTCGLPYTYARRSGFPAAVTDPASVFALFIKNLGAKTKRFRRPADDED